MSEVKKLIISRKKTDKKGNEYALIKISTSQQKRPEIRVIKFKKSPKKSKKKNANEENSSTTKYEKISNNELLKQNLKSKISDSPTNKSSKFTSFISTFNTPSKGKNSFIYSFPKPYNPNHNLRYINPPLLNNKYIYSPNLSKNNSRIFKTEYNDNIRAQKKEKSKKKENLNNKIIILSQKNMQSLGKIKNLKMKQSKLNNIKIKKLKDKQEIIDAKNKAMFETEFKRKLINEIKEINKFQRKAVKGITKKEKTMKKNIIKKDNIKVRNLIKNVKKEDYQKNRYNYLKIRSQEEKLRKRRMNYNYSAGKRVDNHFSFTKLLIDDDQKEIEDLKRKYEKLKVINSEYNSYIKEIQNMDFSRTFTPMDFKNFSRNPISNSIIGALPKRIMSNENSPRKIINRITNKNITGNYFK